MRLVTGLGSFHSSMNVSMGEDGFGLALISGTENVYVLVSGGSDPLLVCVCFSTLISLALSLFSVELMLLLLLLDLCWILLLLLAEKLYAD